MFRDVEFLPEMLNPDNAQFMSCLVEILKIQQKWAQYRWEIHFTLPEKYILDNQRNMTKVSGVQCVVMESWWEPISQWKECCKKTVSHRHNWVAALLPPSLSEKYNLGISWNGHKNIILEWPQMSADQAELNSQDRFHCNRFYIRVH